MLSRPSAALGLTNVMASQNSSKLKVPGELPLRAAIRTLCCQVSTIEIVRLGTDSCKPSVSRCLFQHDLFQLPHSPDSWSHSFLAKRNSSTCGLRFDTNEIDLGFIVTKFIDLGIGFAVGEPLSSEDASCLLST